MQQADLIALLASYVYVFAAILAGELLGRFVFHGSTAFTRKFVHVGVGMWVVGTALLFTNRWIAIIPPLTFIIINYMSYRKDIFKAMSTKDKRNLGTVYFPISFALIILIFWSKLPVVVAGLMPMTWGDALAAVIGQRWGKHRFTVLGSTKSWEGSVAMVVASFVSVFITLAAYKVALGAAALDALIVAAAATVVELLTPLGLDNLTVPLLSALLLWFLL